jgi:hypothetical protein
MMNEPKPKRRVSIGAALRRSKPKCLRCGHGRGSHESRACHGADPCSCRGFVEQYDVLVGYVLRAVAAFPCNGDNGSSTRRPCAAGAKLACPYCTARRLMADPRTFSAGGGDQS